MPNVINNQCPVCKGISPIVGVDGKPEPCSRGCRKTLRRSIQKKAEAEKVKKAKANADKTKNKKRTDD